MFLIFKMIVFTKIVLEFSRWRLDSSNSLFAFYLRWHMLPKICLSLLTSCEHEACESTFQQWISSNWQNVFFVAGDAILRLKNFNNALATKRVQNFFDHILAKCAESFLSFVWYETIIESLEHFFDKKFRENSKRFPKKKVWKHIS